MENQKKQLQSEEIDLGRLFEMIGNGFERLFLLIGSILKGIFHLIILLLQFIRNNIVRFLIASVIGLLIGWVLDIYIEKTYRSSMIVEPNFNSVQQLYNNIEFYNELTKEKEADALAESLKISSEEATSIKEIKIESFSDQTQKIRQFSEFIRELDSTSRKLITYDDYLRNFNDINAKFHKIKIESTNPMVAKKCQLAIVKSIENNQYFKLQKRVNEQNLAIQDTVIKKQLTEIDSLQKFYKNLKILEAKKANGTTNISMAEKSPEANFEIELLRQARLLKESKIKLNTEKANTESTINVISDFPRKGALINDFFTKWKVLFPLIFITITLLITLLLSLNKYLHTYKKT